MRLSLLCAGLIAGVLGFGLDSSGHWGVREAHAQSKSETVRPEVGKPLQAAQDLLKQKKYGEALSKIREVDAVPNKTPYETYVLESMRLSAANGAGDSDTAAKAFEAVVASGKLSEADQLNIMGALINGFFRAKDYSKAMNWGQRYLRSGGTSSQVKTLVVYSQYLSGDYSGAAKALTAEIDANEKNGQTPAKEQLEILANCYLKLGDNNGYIRVLERLVTHYPSKDYWADLLSRIQKKPGGSDRVSLDVFRLKHATGNLRDAADYMEMSQLALQAGYPAEAKKVIDEGFAKGLLGSGADADRQKKLRDFATKQAADDQKALAKGEGAAKSGDALVNLGYAYVTNGDFQKGIDLMEKGIAQGNLKRPEDAKLHLGLAYLKAGEKAKAIRTFRSIQGNDAVADLARLWVVQANRG